MHPTQYFLSFFKIYWQEATQYVLQASSPKNSIKFVFRSYVDTKFYVPTSIHQNLCFFQKPSKPHLVWALRLFYSKFHLAYRAEHTKANCHCHVQVQATR